MEGQTKVERILKLVAFGVLMAFIAAIGTISILMILRVERKWG